MKRKKTLKYKKKDIHAVKIFSAIAVSVFLLGLIFVYSSPVKDNSSQNKNLIEDNFFSGDNCRCLERERLKCSSGWELDEERRLCKNGSDVTNVLLGCSKYECSGNLYNFNLENKEWNLVE